MERGAEADPEAGVVGVVAHLVDVDGVGVELDPVVGLDGCDVPGHLLEVGWGDGGADGLGVDVFGGASGSVDGQQDAAFEDEGFGVGALGESVEERFEEVAGDVLGEGGWSSVRLEVVAGEPGEGAVGLFAAGHVITCRVSRRGCLARGSWVASSIRWAGLPPRRSHSLRACWPSS